MSARADILSALRNSGAPAEELPPIPEFGTPPADSAAAAAAFSAALARLDGTAIGCPAAVDQWLTTTFPDATRICSLVAELTGTIDPGTFTDWAAPADLDVLVMRTPLGIAETGSVLVTEREVPVATAAVLAQHLVVLLDPADIVADLHRGYRHPAFAEAGYAVLLSGPSGSADIGGVTVHPAQGVTTLTVLFAPRAVIR